MFFLAVKTTAAAHDTTGGMETKILEAAMIAKLGIDVFIVKVILNLENYHPNSSWLYNDFSVTAYEYRQAQAIH